MRLGQYAVGFSIKLGARKSVRNSVYSLLDLCMSLDSVTFTVNLVSVGVSSSDRFLAPRSSTRAPTLFSFFSWEEERLRNCLWGTMLALLFFVNLIMALMLYLSITPKFLLVIDSTKCLNAKLEEVKLSNFLFNHQCLIKNLYRFEISSVTFSAKCTSRVEISVKRFLAEMLSKHHIKSKSPALKVCFPRVHVNVVEDRFSAPMYFFLGNLQNIFLHLCEEHCHSSMELPSPAFSALYKLNCVSWKICLRKLCIYAIGGNIFAKNIKIWIPRDSTIICDRENCLSIKLDNLYMKKNEVNRRDLVKKWIELFGQDIEVRSRISVQFRITLDQFRKSESSLKRSTSFDSVSSSIVRLERFQNSLASEMDEQLREKDESCLSLTDAEYSEEDTDIRYDSPIWFGDFAIPPCEVLRDHHSSMRNIRSVSERVLPEPCSTCPSADVLVLEQPMTKRISDLDDSCYRHNPSTDALNAPKRAISSSLSLNDLRSPDEKNHFCLQNSCRAPVIFSPIKLIHDAQSEVGDKGCNDLLVTEEQQQYHCESVGNEDLASDEESFYSSDLSLVNRSDEYSIENEVEKKVPNALDCKTIDAEEVIDGKSSLERSVINSIQGEKFNNDNLEISQGIEIGESLEYNGFVDDVAQEDLEDYPPIPILEQLVSPVTLVEKLEPYVLIGEDKSAEKSYQQRSEGPCSTHESDDIFYEKYERLRALHGFVPGIDPARKEQYLRDQEFTSIFNCSKMEFYALPKWKQDEKKKFVGLF